MTSREGELAGVQVAVQDARAMTFPERPDRAIVYLRLQLQGSPDQLRGWSTCEPRLWDGQGRHWLPLYNQLGIEVVSMLGRNKTLTGSRSCSQSLAGDPPAVSEQAYLVPVEALEDLQLEISGLHTLPKALDMPLGLTVQPLRIR